MNIFFSGIGGVGIGPLAEIAIDAGYEVQGSDRNESPITTRLRRRSISISTTEDDGTFLQLCHEAKPIDWFVHTAALPGSHPELLLAKQLGIKTAKRDELLAHIIKEKDMKLVAVAGTHGKTTTTAMLVWLMKQLSVPVSYSVGATLSFGPSGKYDPKSEYFIYECDEFDRNFLHFSPFLSLVTSIDYDHPDTYPTKDAYLQAFTQFLDQSNHSILWRTDSTDITVPASKSWVLQTNEVQSLKLPGAHNRRNGTLVLKAAEFLDLNGEESKKALETFPGADRRFEKLAKNLYSDYGHHPAEIAATLQLARELSEHVVLVYQPHQNIRQHEIKSSYTDCFESAEEIYWLPTYLSREDPSLPILTPEDLTQSITNRSVVQFAELDTALWQKIEAARAAGKLVLCMGAGTIDVWARQRLTL